MRCGNVAVGRDRELTGDLDVAVAGDRGDLPVEPDGHIRGSVQLQGVVLRLLPRGNVQVNAHRWADGHDRGREKCSGCRKATMVLISPAADEIRWMELSG